MGRSHCDFNSGTFDRLGMGICRSYWRATTVCREEIFDLSTSYFVTKFHPATSHQQHAHASRLTRLPVSWSLSLRLGLAFRVRCACNHFQRLRRATDRRVVSAQIIQMPIGHIATDNVNRRPGHDSLMWRFQLPRPLVQLVLRDDRLWLGLGVV
jgi:hypothetical protein